MKVSAVRTSIFKENGDLLAFITKHIPRLPESSVVAVTSKIAALAEGRVAYPADETERKRLIRRESVWQLETGSPWWLTVRDGSMVVNAGIDESNAKSGVVLLPKDSFKVAESIRNALKKKYRVKKLGVIITDSRISPLRAGVTGLAVGYAGFKGIRDYRGKKDIFGRKLKVTMTDVADSLATAAALVMGEGAEKQPLAIIENAPVQFTERVDRTLKDDLYAPLFKRPPSRPTS
jgi:dihydrofolate synthase / folylpolyglutamate synthase